MSQVDFDYIADRYDETRPSLPVETLQKLIEALSGSKSVLEIGVGTGRIAIPLQENGFDVTGIDISVNMLEIAHKKGLKKFQVADAKSLPFDDSSFDSVLIVHVFHLLEDVRAVMNEAMRVARRNVVTIFTNRPENMDNRRKARGQISELYGKLRSKYGYPLKEGDFERRGFHNEMLIVQEFSPSRVIKAGHFSATVSRDAMLERFLSSSGYVRRSEGLPVKVKFQIEQELKKQVKSLDFPDFIREIEENIAVWDKNDR